MSAETTDKNAVIAPAWEVAAAAMAGAASVETAADIAACLADLARGVGMQRYALIDVAGAMGGEVAALYHDAPAALRNAREDLAGLNADPVVQLARTRAPMPFVWGPELPLYGGSFWATYAQHGYRCGVAASSQDGGGATAIVVLSSSAECVPDELAVPVLGLAATFAATIVGRLAALRPAAPACPLAQRERECILCVLAGLSTKETARHLGIGARTIGQYLERARIKLGAATSFAAGVIAIRRGWITMDEVTALSDAAARPRSRA